FGMSGLAGFMPQGGPGIAETLKQLGVSVPEPLQNMLPGQMKDVLSLQRQLSQTADLAPTAQTLYQDPEKRASLVLSMWRAFNSYIQDQGGAPIGLMQFVQGGGFAPDITTMFQ